MLIIATMMRKQWKPVRECYICDNAAIPITFDFEIRERVKYGGARYMTTYEIGLCFNCQDIIATFYSSPLRLVGYDIWDAMDGFPEKKHVLLLKNPRAILMMVYKLSLDSRSRFSLLPSELIAYIQRCFIVNVNNELPDPHYYTLNLIIE